MLAPFTKVIPLKNLKFYLPCLLFAVCNLSFAQTVQTSTLSDADINILIQNGFKGDGHWILHEPGVHLYDKWASLGAAADKTGNQTSGFSVDIFTPSAWIEYQAFLAHKKMMPFTLESVTPDMRREVVRVVAHPNTPRQVSARGMAWTSNVDHVVMQDSAKKTVIQPISETASDRQVQSAVSSPLTMYGQIAEFAVEDVRKIRGVDGQAEFFVTVIGETKKDFKVKTKDFAKL
jgi:hypothetical protein